MNPVLLIAALLALTSAVAQPAAEIKIAPPRMLRVTQLSDDGIAKVYMGRQIAQVMGHQGASWLERPEREREEHSAAIVQELELKHGDVVADIGAGTGYFSRQLAPKVGPAGRVYAVDIQPEMLTELTNRLARVSITNVVPVLGSDKNPGLQPDSVDLVLMVDVYHELAFPQEMMESICRALKPGGRVALVEYRGEDPSIPIKPLHKMTEAQVKNEMAVHPLEWVRTVKTFPQQNLIIFRRNW